MFRFSGNTNKRIDNVYQTSTELDHKQQKNANQLASLEAKIDSIKTTSYNQSGLFKAIRNKLDESNTKLEELLIKENIQPPQGNSFKAK